MIDIFIITYYNTLDKTALLKLKTVLIYVIKILIYLYLIIIC